MKLPTREQLVKRRAIVMADAQMKLEVADWHGCADACMDLREIDAQIALLDYLREGESVGRSRFEQEELADRNREAIARSSAASGWNTMPECDLEGAILPDGAVVGKRVA